MAKKILLHLAIIIIVTILIILGSLSLLDRYTRHGQVYVTPDFTGLNHQEIIQNYGSIFKFIIADSIYDRSLPFGSVLQQDPLPGAKVKQNRNVYFIIVARQPEKIAMPNLENLSVRQAIVSLEAVGLETADITFVDHFARNAVVEQLFMGEPVEPGTLLFRGTKIELVLGNGGQLSSINFPMIYGKKPVEARQLLRIATLNIGNEYFLDGDTLNSRVFKVEPYLLPGDEILPATYISIWYRSEDAVDFDAFLNDSLYIEKTDEFSINNEDTEF